MRKIFYIICIALICVTTSCSNTTAGKTAADKMTQTSEHFMKVYNSDNSVKSNIPIWHAEYNGHHYLMISSGNGRTIVHDPDCPCN